MDGVESVQMDRRSWLWRRKSSEKSPGETESSGSVSSSLSERFSDEQDMLRGSPKNAESPEVSPKVSDSEGNESVKALSEKLAAAALEIRAKDDVVKQHSKVAQEAILGWEKAQNEIAALKQQLNFATQKNSSLGDRIGHLDGALKECVRQLRLVRNDQDQKVNEALFQQAKKWESEKMNMEIQIIEFKAKSEARDEVSSAFNDQGISLKLDSLQKENSALRAELLARSEELQLKTIEKELSTKAAETASKQHLESIKKVAKLEAECRKLQAATRRSSLNIELRRTSSVCAESITDSQSDYGESLSGLDNETSCSDSFTSALVKELDQSRSEKNSTRSFDRVDMDLMDDFLEMERLAAVNQADPMSDVTRESPSNSEVQDGNVQSAKLEEKVRKLTAEKTEREKALDEAQSELRICRHQSRAAEKKSGELQRQLNLVNGKNHAVGTEIEALEVKGNELEQQLQSANTVVSKLKDKVRFLEKQVEAEKALSLELASRCQHMNAVEMGRKETELKLLSAHSENQKLHEKISSLERRVEEEKAFSARLAGKCHGMEAMEAKKKHLELELESAQKEISLLQENVHSLECEVEEKKVLSEELASQYQDVKNMQSRLEAAKSEIVRLTEKNNVLERNINQERVLSAELAVKCANVESEQATRKEVEAQLESAHVEMKTLKENLSSLEKKLENAKNLSAVYTASLDASEEHRSKLMSQLELAHKEADELRAKLGLLEQVVKERAISSEFAAECRSLEDELSRNTQEHRLQQPWINQELQIQQERERAAGKLEECQKTMASISRQLKLLANLDDFMLESENDGISADDLDGDLKALHSATYSENLGCLSVS